MRFYIYNDDGYLTSVLETDDEKYPQPENSTQVEPPTLGQDQICRFDGNAWIVEEKPTSPQSEGSTPPSLEDRLASAEAAILALMEVIG